MNMRDLIPWTRSQDLLPEYFRDERSSPFLTLHREMNRLLEEAFRGFASTSFAGRRTDFVNSAWPKLEVAETEKQITVSAEIPGMEEKDVETPGHPGHANISRSDGLAKPAASARELEAALTQTP